MEVLQECLISDVAEEWKRRGVPVLSHAGIICTSETYKDKMKLTFEKGASLKGPSGLFHQHIENDLIRYLEKV